MQVDVVRRPVEVVVTLTEEEARELKDEWIGYAGTPGRLAVYLTSALSSK